MKTNTNKIIERKLDSLKPHPQQAKLFPPLSKAKLQALADDIEQNGLQQPIEILPDGVIICGHQRVAAYKLLGRTEIECRVRDDLAVAGDAAVQARLIEDNLNRRQMGELDIARIYRHLKQQQPGKRAANGNGDLRDSIAKRFDVSGRTLSRWEQLLDADPGIQAAFSQRRMTLAEAIKVASLPAKTQQKIVAGLAEDKEFKDLLPRPANRRPATPAEPTLGQLLQKLSAITDKLQNVDLPTATKAADRNVLNRSRRVLRELQQRLKVQAESVTNTHTTRTV